MGSNHLSETTADLAAVAALLEIAEELGVWTSAQRRGGPGEHVGGTQDRALHRVPAAQARLAWARWTTKALLPMPDAPVTTPNR